MEYRTHNTSRMYAPSLVIPWPSGPAASRLSGRPVAVFPSAWSLYLSLVSPASPRSMQLHGRSADVIAPSREEQDRYEGLWATSEWTYDADRRREVCTLWIDYHEHLAGVFRSHVAHHESEQERYQRMLAEESEDAE